MFVSIQENQDLIPSLLTLALNDAATYDKVRYNLGVAYHLCQRLVKGKTYVFAY